MAAWMREKRARLGVLAAACVAVVALAVTLGLTQRGDANPLTCTARTLGVPRESNPGLAADCDALLAIKSALGVSGWSAGTVLRHWRGVTLGGTPKRVTGLDLSDNRLTGSIPTQLVGLTALTALDLSGNTLSGDLPAGLRDMPPTLATLHLAGNSFTGCIDERLRLAEANDLATLMTARGLGWCPVATAPQGALAAGTYELHGDLIVDIPADGPRVQRYVRIVAGGGFHYCLSDVTETRQVCFHAQSGQESLRGSVYRSSRHGASGAGDPASPAGLETVFDKIAATVRTVP